MIKSMLYRMSLLQALVVMIFISLLLPLPVLMLVYTNSIYEQKQQTFTAVNTKKFHLSSDIFVESLWNYYPSLGQKMLDQLTLDSSVKFVRVKDSDDKLFLGWQNPHSTESHENIMYLSKVLEKDGMVIGSLEMAFIRQDVLSSLLSDMALFGSIVALQIFCLVLVISWIYYTKILKPIRQLVQDANQLANQKLDEPFHWDENDEIGILGRTFDKTRLKLKELFDALKQENMFLDAKVQQRTKELEDASRYKSEFLANMSHEIRTPMNAIMGMSHLLSKTAMNVTQANYVGKIKESSSVLLRIINDILDFSKIEAGKMDVELVAFDLHKELKKSCSIFSVLAKEKQIEFQCDFVETNRFFRGDPCKIMQIVNNFLSNAIKFTSEGAVMLSLHEEVINAHQSKLVFGVRDSGIGIAKEKQALLFKAFSQVDASITRKHGGTGLGLYICTQLAHMMHGEIALHSEEGRGSLFELSLSLERASGLDLQTDNSAHAYEPLRILLIEDDKKTAESLCEYIRSFGFFVTPLTSSDDVIKMLTDQGETFHLMMLDYELARSVEGLSFYKNISSKIDKDLLPVTLMFASDDDNELKSRVIDAGIKSLLKKPINPSMLYDELSSLYSLSTSVPLFDPSKINLSHKHILVVEDNEINLEVATYLLKETQANVEIARNGLEAVEKLQEQTHPFDVILMDIQMPIMDGYEATRIIRKELNILTPIIAMTANVMIQDIEKCLAMGMDAHIGKPFEVEDFYGTLLEVLHVSLKTHPKIGKKETKAIKVSFNKREAIQKLAGNEALWNKVLGNFYEMYLQFPEKLNTLYAKNDKTTLIDYVHTIKGLSGTIGAFLFEEKLANFENHLTSDEPLQTLSKVPLMEEYNALLDTLKAEILALEASHTVVKNTYRNDAKQAKELFEALEKALLSSNISKINPLLEQIVLEDATLEQNASFKALLLSAKSFDFDIALEHLKQLKECDVG